MRYRSDECYEAFLMSYKVVLTFKSVDESVNIKLKQRSRNLLFAPSKVIRNSTKNPNPTNDWNL